MRKRQFYCSNSRHWVYSCALTTLGQDIPSLSRLRQFPIDTLKVDRSFVSTMSEEGESREVVNAIVTLAHHLGMDVVAEGVETAHQLSQLKELGCEYGQGYFFAKPLNYQAAEAFITNS